MSHMATVKTKLRDPKGIERACTKLGLDAPVRGRHAYGGNDPGTTEVHVEGTLVQLKGWTLPICIQDDGTVCFDNWGERWGKTSELNEFKQTYAVEMVRMQAESFGHTLTETQLEDGSIKLEVVEYA